MKSRIEDVYLFLNYIFYVGIIFVVYLYLQEDNTTLWLIAMGMIVAGMLGILIPVNLVNNGIESIRSTTIRSVILDKYIIFCVFFSCLNKYFFATMLTIILFLAVDVFLEKTLMAQMKSIDMSVKQFAEQLKTVHMPAEDSMLKYYGCYTFGILLYLHMHSGFYETLIMISINIVIQVIVSIKINSMLKCTGKQRAQVLLWFVFGVTIIAASFDYGMIVYSFVGLYVMISSDVLSKRKFSLFPT